MRQALGWIVAFALICIVAAALWALVDTLIDLYRRWACRREMQRAERNIIAGFQAATLMMKATKFGLSPEVDAARSKQLDALNAEFSRRVQLDAAATAQDRRFRKDVN